MAKATIEIDVSVATRWERMQALLSEGLEAGSYATFGIAGYEVPPALTLARRTATDVVFKHLDYPVNEGGAVWLTNRHDERENDPDTEPASWVQTRVVDGFTHFKLDIPTLERGMQAFAEKAPRQFLIWFTDSPEEDAITGDAFLQCCIFGEVVYS